MARKRASMRRIREILRLVKGSGISSNQAAEICRIGRTTAQEYLLRFSASQLPWPVPAAMTDTELEHRLFPTKPAKHLTTDKLDFGYLLSELRRPNVTMALLWEEYKQQHPDGYQYSYFCDLLSRYRKTLNYSMRMEHKAGEKCFLDFGEGLGYVNRHTGEWMNTQLFVMCWGASNYTFSRAVPGEGLESWIKVNVAALEFFGCCPKVEVPDNLKSAVSKACRYEPEVNPTYAEFARHYGLTIMPARPHAPKDKAKVEAAVKLAKRWILARLRNHLFTSLEEMNQAIEAALTVFNNKTMKALKKSRSELFESLDKPHALPLPEQRYEYAQWKQATVNINYHIQFELHHYSAPYTYIHQQVEVRVTADSVEVCQKGKRICAHPRSYQAHGYTTCREHMPPSHQKYLEWTPERILAWAGQLGPSVKQLVEQIMASRTFPEQAYKSCLGIIRLEKSFGQERLEASCKRALLYRNHSYRGVRRILEKGLDKTTEAAPTQKPIIHPNIRGANYYQQTLSNAEERGIAC